MKADLDNKAIAAEKHAATQAEHAATKAKAAADEDRACIARSGTARIRAEAVTSAEAKAQHNEEMGMAQDVQAARADAGDRMAAQMGPAELQQVVAAVGRNRTMNSTLGFTLAQQVDYYMSQLEAKMVGGLHPAAWATTTGRASSSTRAGGTDRCPTTSALPGPRAATRRLFTLRPALTGPCSRSSSRRSPAPRPRACTMSRSTRAHRTAAGGIPELRFCASWGP